MNKELEELLISLGFVKSNRSKESCTTYILTRLKDESLTKLVHTQHIVRYWTNLRNCELYGYTATITKHQLKNCFKNNLQDYFENIYRLPTKHIKVIYELPQVDKSDYLLHDLIKHLTQY